MTMWTAFNGCEASNCNNNNRFFDSAHKDHREETKPDEKEFSLKMEIGSMYIPKERFNKPCGEDAHFVYGNKTIGIADGVGYWKRIGIDAGEYARKLMQNSVIALQKRGSKTINPKRILQRAYKNTDVEGSSTACIVTLSGNKIRAANVGDSGFLVIRKGKVLYKSRRQQHKFNCPYQLGKTGDKPDLAQLIEVVVEDEDLIVVGTDGLWDNVHVEDLLNIISEHDGGDMTELSCYLANEALYNSFNRYIDTPFSIELTNHRGRVRRGGKIDDITVVIAKVVGSCSNGGLI